MKLLGVLLCAVAASAFGLQAPSAGSTHEVQAQIEEWRQQLLGGSVRGEGEGEREHRHGEAERERERRREEEERRRKEAETHRHDRKLRPVLTLDPNRVVGRWYQVYTNLATKVLSEGGADATCYTTDIYRGAGNTTFNWVAGSMVNDGLIVMSGQYHVINTSLPGLLHATMAGPQRMFRRQQPQTMLPNFMIVDVGGQSRDEDSTDTASEDAGRRHRSRQYDYMVMTDPHGLSLFVLARSPEAFRSHEKQVLRRLDKMGFDRHFNRPVHMAHHHCRYRHHVAPSVSSLNLTKMAGRFYQMAHNGMTEVFNNFTYNARCLSCDFSVGEDGKTLTCDSSKVTVPDGTLQQGQHTLVQEDPNLPGELTFTNAESELINGLKLRIMKIGPLDKETNLYKYVIATDENHLMLLVSVSNGDFYYDYKDEIEKFVEMEGFSKWWNRAVEVDHNMCSYRDLPTHKVHSNTRPANGFFPAWLEL